MEYFYELDKMARGVVSKYTKDEKFGKWVGRPTHGAAITGEKMHFAMIEKTPNTGSTEIHHPNEQFIYVLQGTLKSKVGDQEKIIGPGTAVHVPPNVVHGNICISEETCLYITVKDKEWGLEALPKGMTVEEFKAEAKRQDDAKDK